MVSGMGMGPGPGQGSWPPVSLPQQNPGNPQYPAPYQGQPQQGQMGPGQMAPGQIGQPGQPQQGPGGQGPGGMAGPGGPARYSTGAGFPVAEPFDGTNPDGTPRIVRPQLDPRELPALQAYLTQAPVVLAAPGNAQDELVPSAGAAIPRSFHSDGAWVWPASVGYYLVRYQLPPSDALLAHIRSRNYQLTFVPQETRSAAANELMAILNAPAPPPMAAQAPPVSPPLPPLPQGGQMGQGGPVGQPGLIGQQGPVGQLGPIGQIGQPLNVAPPQIPAPSLPPVPTPIPAPISAPVSAPVSAPNALQQGPIQALAPIPAPVLPPLPAPPVSLPSVQPSEQARPVASPALAPAEPVSPAGPTMVFSAAEAMAQWSSLDSSLPQAEAPLAPTHFGTEFSAAGNKHAAWVSEQLETFTSYMPTGEWSVDHETRTYTQSERSFTVDGLGTLSAEGIWTWAWSEFSGWDKDSGILDQSRILRNLADRQNIAELTSGALDLTTVADAEDPETAAEMLAWTAMGILGARGYIGHSSKNGGRIYYLVTDSLVPLAEPSLGSIPRHVLEGTAVFGEDAAECVVGYAEHHGWEWNRTADGIAVQATGVGSFAVEIVDDRLVGLSLHI